MQHATKRTTWILLSTWMKWALNLTTAMNHQHLSPYEKCLFFFVPTVYFFLSSSSFFCAPNKLFDIVYSFFFLLHFYLYIFRFIAIQFDSVHIYTIRLVSIWLVYCVQIERLICKQLSCISSSFSSSHSAILVIRRVFFVFSFIRLT